MNKEKENERTRQNQDFVMYFRPFLDDLARLAGENYTAYRLFQLLCKHMDGTNALVISMVALSEIMGLSRQTISKAVHYLSDNGWICVYKSGTSNVYVVNPDVAWTSYADQKASCKFKANVILSGTENADFLKNPNAATHYKTINDEFIQAVKANKESFEQDVERIKACEM